MILRGSSNDTTNDTTAAPDFQVGHRERLPLGMPYPAIVFYVGLLAKLPGHPELVIDITGLGQPVFDLFVYSSGIYPTGVFITGGMTETRTAEPAPCQSSIRSAVCRFCCIRRASRSLRELDEAETLVPGAARFPHGIHWGRSHDVQCTLW